MSTSFKDLPKYPVWPTVLNMTLLALIGSAFWWAGTFAGNAAVVTASGPFAWITLGPALIATYGAVAMAGASLMPLWAVGGGRFFARRASGIDGKAMREMEVTLFSEGHPITRATQQLAARMELPPIAYVGWFPNEEINAFAMGDSRENALIAVSKGAVARLTREELVAVIAHELGHVFSNDMAKMTAARGVQEALTFFLLFRGLKTFARWIFTPLSELELLRMSRNREFIADLTAAIVFRPESMIAALERLRHEQIAPQTRGYAQLLMWSGFKAGGIFDTHPRLEERIARLEAFSKAAQQGNEG